MYDSINMWVMHNISDSQSNHVNLLNSEFISQIFRILVVYEDDKLKKKKSYIIVKTIVRNFLSLNPSGVGN